MRQSMGSQTVGYDLATEQQNRREVQPSLITWPLCPPEPTGCKAHSLPGLRLSHCSRFFGVGQEYAVNHSTDGRARSHTLHPQTFRPQVICGPELCQGYKSTNKKGYIMSPSLAVHHTAMPGPYSKFSKSFMLVHIEQQTNLHILNL